MPVPSYQPDGCNGKHVHGHRRTCNKAVLQAAAKKFGREAENQTQGVQTKVAHLSLEDDVLVLPVLDDADRLQRANDVVRVGSHLLTDI